MQPWLGTYVLVRTYGIPAGQARGAIDAAFEEVALVHRLMSFHTSDSDVTRLNRYAFREAVDVHPWTLEVLRLALEVSCISAGCFDASIGARLVEWKFLPSPSDEPCDEDATWKDIEITPEERVVFHRRLWIDFGGIAKGYAVDRAVERLLSMGVENALVNAGGDIRVIGRDAETIALDTGQETGLLPVVKLQNGSIASSTGSRTKRVHSGREVGPHVDGASRSAVRPDRFASVVAKHCAIADSLTKVVLAAGGKSKEILGHYGAQAHLYTPDNEWQSYY